jgi:16S rRNA (cytidine1402-2'-O)-methyltransferase
MTKHGTLYIVATPIGNLGDMSARATETLSKVDAIYSEDTRVTRRLLSAFEIKTPTHRADSNVLAQKTDEIISRLQNGENIAYTTDAGTPAISDPGSRLVEAVRAAELSVEVIAGASALTAAISGSGLDSSKVFFVGFLPRKSGKRRTLLENMAGISVEINSTVLLVFYESSKRTVAILEELNEVFGSARICLARELTKLHEEFLVGTASEIHALLSERPGELKGEVVLLIESKAK